MASRLALSRPYASTLRSLRTAVPFAARSYASAGVGAASNPKVLFFVLASFEQG